MEKAESKNFQVTTPREFELSVVNTKDKNGIFHIFIADVGVKYEKEYISKIKLSYRYKSYLGFCVVCVGSSFCKKSSVMNYNLH